MTGLEILKSQTVASPSDALGNAAYDNNTNTSATTNVSTWTKINIDSSLVGKKLTIKAQTPYRAGYGNVTVRIVADNGDILLTQSQGVDTVVFDFTLVIPERASQLQFYRAGYAALIYELQFINEPTFSVENEYMLISADTSKSVKDPYQMVSISYMETSSQRLYRIGTTGDWLNYNDQSIKVIQGQTIYAKGIDKYGNETRITSSLTSNISDSLSRVVFDGNDSTYQQNILNQHMKVDTSMQGKRVRIVWRGYYNNSAYQSSYIYFLDDKKQLISSISTTGNSTLNDTIYVIPIGTSWIRVYAPEGVGGGKGSVYEIQACNEPTFTATNGYMLLTADTSKAVRDPYQMVSISYFETSVQRLYRIGTTGDWLNYNDIPIKVIQGQTIYAKGIDKYGNQTRIVSSLTANVSNSLTRAVYDGNDSTYQQNILNLYMRVDSSMYGRNARIVWRGYYSNDYQKSYIYFLDINMNQLGSISTTGNSTLNDKLYVIPNGTYWIKVYAPEGVGGGKGSVYEIQAK
ncbi:hypothetical protein D3C76_789640 [compost metagenome]